MISIVICSVDELLLDAVKENVEDTIGVPYEILAVNNKPGNKGLCQVYNETASLAKYDILCFIHEDVKIHTMYWGSILQKLLADNDIGLVGISGAVYKSAFPSTWSSCVPELYRTHSIQHFKNNPEPQLSHVNPDNSLYAGVAVVDGVFMATRKEVWENNKFDSENLKGFHGYDIDFSLRVGLQYNVVVSFEILLEHFSEGSLTKAWLNDSLQVHRKWRQRLPLKVALLTNGVQKRSDYKSCQSFLVNATSVKASKWLILKYYLILLFKFFTLNRLKHTRTTFRYLFNLEN